MSTEQHFLDLRKNRNRPDRFKELKNRIKRQNEEAEIIVCVLRHYKVHPKVLNFVYFDNEHWENI